MLVHIPLLDVVRVRLSVVALLAAVIFACIGTPADAATTVTGDQEVSPPLVIDPDSGSEPLTFERDLAGGGQLMFIQKMPLTKRIRTVTLGDLGWGSSCTTPTRANLSVREHATPDFQGYPQPIASSPLVTLPQELGKVTFTLSSPARLVEGRAYSFKVTWSGSGADCRYAKVRSWRHELDAVNSGPMKCADGPPMIRQDGSSPPNYRRMWHTRDVSDSQSTCVGSPAGFDSSMPSGWLVTSHSYYGGVQTYQIPVDPPAGWSYKTCGNASDFGNRGVSELGWRELRSQWYDQDGVWHDEVYANEYVCAWTSFLPPDSPSPDGWYYSIPWIQSDAGQGLPRTMYLKLESVSYDILLQRFRPNIKYDSQDPYRADSPAVMASNPDYSLWTADQWQPVTLETLGSPYSTGAPASEDDELVGIDDDYEASYASMRASSPSFLDKTYAHVAAADDGSLVLQYWLFYMHQPDSVANLWGEHEGDWEMVQVHLDVNDAPQDVTYAQHNDGQWCSWLDIEKSTANTPDVYPSEESHASYFSAGYHGTVWTDHANGEGDWTIPSVVEVTESTPFIRWPGHWGSTLDPRSPQGPSHQDNNGKWSHPEGWSAGLDGCT
jgi:hypothetical protein